jgi:hypothetical protein
VTALPDALIQWDPCAEAQAGPLLFDAAMKGFREQQSSSHGWFKMVATSRISVPR